MKTLLLNLWVWIVAHPAEVLGALYLVLNAVNAAIPVERRKGSLALRVLDRLCVLTQRSAANGASWPVFGRSIAKEIVTASLGDRETQAPPPPSDPPPSDPPPSEPGFAERGVIAVIAGVAMLALGVALLSGCPMPAPDGCSPGARRCHEDTPQVCSPGQRWTPADVTCSTVNASCVVRDGVPACLRGEQ